jgi:hypothetical protein
MSKSTSIKDFLQDKNVGKMSDSSDAEKTINDIVKDFKHDNVKDFKHDNERYENTLRERDQPIQTNNSAQHQVDDLTSKLHQQLLQQQILQEQLIQHNMSASNSFFSTISTYIHSTVYKEFNYITCMIVLYIIFQNVDITSVLKFDKYSFTKSSPLIKPIIQSVVFTLFALVIKRHV